MEPHAVAEGAHARLALADAPEAEAEGRAHEHAHRGPGEGGHDEREVEERERRGEAPRQPELWPGHARDAVVALGHRDPAEGEPPDDHPEGERDHEEVGARRADRQEAEQGGRGRREQEAGAETSREPHLVLRAEDADGVRGDPEVGGVAERGEPGVAEEHVEAHREDRDDHRLRQERERVRGQERGDATGQRQRRHAREHLAVEGHARPKSPVGLRARMSAIGANSVK